MTFERRIGGEMEITAGQLRGTALSGVWPAFAGEHVLQCDTGRSALRLALLDWMRERPLHGAVWIPSYVCATVPEAVAAAGLRAITYSDRPGLQSWPTPPMPAAEDIVVVIHYFGVVNRAACLWLDGLMRRQWALLEDCVQAPYSAGVGVRGDYAVASLRKWWPAPDGAVLCSRRPIAVPDLSPPNEQYVSQRVSAKLLNGSRECETTCLQWIEESEQLLADAEPRQVSWISRSLLASADLQSATAARRHNWSVLLRGLQAGDRIRPVFGPLADGEVPLGFPVLVRAGLRDSLRAFLTHRRVFCPVHWKLARAHSSADRAMSEQMLTIPLDQRYHSEDMRIVLGHVAEFLANQQ